jgi:hypothetical protein
LPTQHPNIVKNICIYTNTHIWLRRNCIWITVATKEHCERNISTQIGSGEKCWLDISHWAPAWRWLGEYVTLDRRFYNPHNQQLAQVSTWEPDEHSLRCTISFAVFLKETERLALDLSAHTLCCFVTEQLIPSDKTRRRRSDDFEVTDKHFFFFSFFSVGPGG